MKFTSVTLTLVTGVTAGSPFLSGNPGNVGKLPSVMDTKKYTDIVMGLSDGFGLGLTVSCLGESEDIEPYLNRAMKDFLKHSYHGVKDGLHEIGAAFELLKPTIQGCKGAEDELERFEEAVKQFKNPARFVYEVSKHLTVNSIDIYRDIRNSQQHYAHQEYRAFGESTGNALKLMVFGKTTTKLNISAVKFSLADFKSLMMGLSEGFKLGLVEDCITDVVDVGGDLEIAAKDFMKRTKSGAVDGLKSLAKAMGHVLPVIKSCKGAETAFVQLVVALHQFNSPSAFAWHIGKDILLNGANIYVDITESASSWQKRDLQKFGYSVGHALRLIVIGLRNQLSDDHALLGGRREAAAGIVVGVARGFGVTIKEECVSDADTLVISLDTVVEDFKKRTVSGYIAGLKGMAVSLETVVKTMEQCEAAKGDVERIIHALEQFRSPMSFVYHVGRDLRVNGADILMDISAAVSQWTEQKYEPFGESVGIALKLVLLGKDDTQKLGGEMDIFV